LVGFYLHIVAVCPLPLVLLQRFPHLVTVHGWLPLSPLYDCIHCYTIVVLGSGLTFFTGSLYYTIPTVLWLRLGCCCYPTPCGYIAATFFWFIAALDCLGCTLRAFVLPSHARGSRGYCRWICTFADYLRIARLRYAPRLYVTHLPAGLPDLPRLLYVTLRCYGLPALPAFTLLPFFFFFIAPSACSVPWIALALVLQFCYPCRFCAPCIPLVRLVALPCSG